MLESVQNKRGKLIYHESFMYKINESMQKYIWNAIADAVQKW